MFKFKKNSFSEESKYDLHAELSNIASEPDLGPYLNLPYEAYNELIQKKIMPSHSVLELGCGTGERSTCILDQECDYYGCDISMNSLNKFRDRFCSHHNFRNVHLMKSDFYNLHSMINRKFDFVVGAGILSYIEKPQLSQLLSSLLNDGGELIFVDSWNKNYIYSINRRLQYLLNQRSLSTIENMPDQNLYKDFLSQNFAQEKLDFFNHFAWLWPLKGLINQDYLLKFLLYLDQNLSFFSPPFKVVMNLKKL